MSNVNFDRVNGRLFVMAAIIFVRGIKFKYRLKYDTFNCYQCTGYLGLS